MKKFNKIAIIDDDETTCYLNKIFLKDVEIVEVEEVECFHDASKALKHFLEICQDNDYEGDLPDLILLDINMPIMDGFEFLQKVKELEELQHLCSQRIVMFTSSFHPKDFEKAKSFGVLAYVTKPLNEEKVKHIIERYACPS